MSNTSTTPVKPRRGSRTFLLSLLEVNDCHYFEVKPGSTQTVTQQQILVDAKRIGIVIKQECLLAVSARNRNVSDLVRVTRIT
jgi:hypothetical protein